MKGKFAEAIFGLTPSIDVSQLMMLALKAFATNPVALIDHDRCIKLGNSETLRPVIDGLGLSSMKLPLSA